MMSPAEVRDALVATRTETLQFFQSVNDADFTRHVHRDFSPLGWHLGHIGVTEAYWILQRCQGKPSLSPFYESFFTPTDNPKPNRVHLPPREELLLYLQTVRTQVLDFLATVEFRANDPLLAEANIFSMLLQHEEQHLETMTVIRQLLMAERYRSDVLSGTSRLAAKSPLASLFPREEPASLLTRGDWAAVRLGGEYSQAVTPSGVPRQTGQEFASPDDMVLIPAGPFAMGSNALGLTLDNERPQHLVYVDKFLLQRYPVTNRDFLQFIERGGYHEPRWWSAEGWHWRERQAVEHPLYWCQDAQGQWYEIEGNRILSLVLHRPVICISWYEADAYARSIGRRLPTETEWEKAAASGYLSEIGEVWEWTSTWFHPYAGFAPHPYAGYSVPYFDQQHRVLKGGSWATRQHVRRLTFRNWYHPWVREIFAGVRCVQDEQREKGLSYED